MSTDDPLTGTQPFIDTTQSGRDPGDVLTWSSEELARENAIRAVAVALEHRWPAIDYDEHVKAATTLIDVVLLVGWGRWAILSPGSADDVHRVAVAVLATNQDHVGEPTATDLAAAAQVINALVNR